MSVKQLGKPYRFTDDDVAPGAPAVYHRAMDVCEHCGDWDVDDGSRLCCYPPRGEAARRDVFLCAACWETPGAVRTQIEKWLSLGFFGRLGEEVKALWRRVWA
jgi:hypothetical protein